MKGNLARKEESESNLSSNYEEGKREKQITEEILRTEATCIKSSIEEILIFYFAISLYPNDSRRWTYWHQIGLGI